jgi:DNA-binding transcriptional ArsR family regulator
MTQAKTDLFDSELQELAQLFKALGHPARLQILNYLGSRSTCFSGDITEIVPLGRTTVNQHIAELKKAGLIKGTIQGSKTNYCLNPDGIKKLSELGIDFCSRFEHTIKCLPKECL